MKKHKIDVIEGTAQLERAAAPSVTVALKAGGRAAR